MKNNSANLALIYVSAGSNISISNSTFKDNYSTGRGSIVFSENQNSFASFTNSTFERNQAILGGVFYTQLNGMITTDNCNISNNFAVYGGVLYSQNEG